MTYIIEVHAQFDAGTPFVRRQTVQGANEKSARAKAARELRRVYESASVKTTRVVGELAMR